MAANLYEAALEDLNDDPQVVDRYDEIIRQQQEQLKTTLMVSGQAAADTTPEQAAKDLATAKRFGVPPGLAEKAFAPLRKQHEVEQNRYDAIIKQTPALAQWLQDPGNHAVAKDDLAQLGFLEWLVTAPRRAYARGVDQTKLANLRFESLFRSLSQDEEQQLEGYRQGMEKGGALGAQNWFSGAIVGGAEQLPNLVGAGLAGLQYAKQGLLIGMTAGAVPGSGVPGAGTLAGAAAGGLAGMSAGTIYGGWNYTARLEAGLAYDEYLQVRDEYGRRLDPAVAKGAALAAGAINGGLELVQLEALVRYIPGAQLLTRAGVRTAVKAALRSPSIRAAIGEAVKQYGGTLATETATEVAQRIVTILGEEGGKALGLTGLSPGQLEAGNIKLADQPAVLNPDGKASTVDSVSVEIDGVEVLLPTVTPDGRHFTGPTAADQAEAEYRRTGRHLGKFATPTAADAYAKQLHEAYERGRYGTKPAVMPAETTALSMADEQAFQAWAQANQITDVDAAPYDYRGYWIATKGAPHPPGTHFPDTFKQHGHPTFSSESQYSRGVGDGGRWQGEVFTTEQGARFDMTDPAQRAAFEARPPAAAPAAPAGGQFQFRRPTDYLAEMLSEGAGALQAFALMSGFGPTLHVAVETARAKNVRFNELFFKALGEGAAQSKTIERMPEAAQTFLKEATKQGGVETLYAPAGTWVEYWQSQGVDPAAMAAEVTGSVDALPNALKHNQDLAIPTERYAVTLARTKHNAFFTNELRLDPDEMNGREFKERKGDLSAMVEAAIAAATAGEERPMRAAVDAMVAGGRLPAHVADSYANLLEAAFTQLADVEGLTPEQYLRTFSVQTTRPDLEGVARATGTPGAPPAGGLAAAATGEVARRAPGEQPGVDPGGAVETGGDAGRAGVGRLSPFARPVPAELDERFVRRPLTENAARLVPDVRRELQHLLEELETFPYVPRTWNWLQGRAAQSGNAAGGQADIVGAVPQARAYGDVLAFAPLNAGKGGKAARQARGTGQQIRNAVRQLLDTGAVHNNLAEGALRVAEARAKGDWTYLSPLELPRPWAEAAPPELVDQLSTAIDDALGGPTDLTDADTFDEMREPEGAVDTSFNIDEFTQSLFDETLPPDPAIDQMTQPTPAGEQQPVLPGAEGVREQEIATPPVAEAPFALTPPVAKPEPNAQRELFQTTTQKNPNSRLHELLRAPAAFVGGLLRMSTRLPLGPSAIARTEVLETNLAVLDEDPKLVRDAKVRYAGVALEHPLITDAERAAMSRTVDTKWGPRYIAHDPDAVLALFLTRVKGNLRYLWNQMAPELRARARQWYVGAHRIAGQLADQYGITHAQASALLAVLSPQMDWFKNVAVARRLIKHYTFAEKKNPVFDDDRFARYRRRNLDAIGTKTRGNRAAILAEIKEVKEKYLGKRWRQMDLEGQAIMIRALDEEETDFSYPVILPEGDDGARRTNDDGSLSRIGWGTNYHISNGIAALRDGSVANISYRLGEGHKVRSFFNNISDPSNAGSVTIDTHAVAAALLQALVGTDDAVEDTLGGRPNAISVGLNGFNAAFAQAYFDLAAELSTELGEVILPREVQSVTWEVIRLLFPSDEKDEALTAKIDAVWADWQRGTILDHGRAITLDDVYARIFAIAKPDGQLGSPAWADTPSRLAGDEGVVRAGAVLPGGPGVPAARGAEGGGAAGSGRRPPAHPDGVVPAERAAESGRPGAVSGPAGAGPDQGRRVKPARGGVRELAQSVYHGSRHIFEKFSLHAIGTGEGALAYGWGLYFASIKAVADGYRARLSGGGRGEVLVRGARLQAPFSFLRSAALTLLDNLKAGLTFEQAKTLGLRDLEARLRYERAHNLATADSYAEELEAAVKEWATLEEGDITERRFGRTYTAEIPEDDDFLAWDKPASQQSPKVQAALQQLGIEWTPTKYPTRDAIIKKLEKQAKAGPAPGWGTIGTDTHEMIIDGLHLAHYGSDAELHAWIDEHQKALGLKFDPLGSTVYAQLSQRFTEQVTIRSQVGTYGGVKASAEAASKALNAHGVAGIRYLDGFSRQTGEGSSNYVVFDDQLVQITEYDQPFRALTQEDVRQWANDLKETVGPDLALLDVRLMPNGDLDLETLAVSRGAQRAGLGSRVMRELTRFADLNGRRVVLSLARKGYQPVEGGVATTSRTRLATFYKRFGFVENTGRHKDYTASIYTSMYREPTHGAAVAPMTELESPRRGSIRFGPERQFLISLFERADLSTFLHESGHLFLTLMGDSVGRLQARQAGGETLTDRQQRAIVDYETILAELGATPGEKLTDEQHEQFARLFEAYLMEGKAPSVALQSSFTKFRGWLLGIYRTLTNLNVELSDEVRTVFNRLLASDEAIAKAEAERNVPPILMAKPEGMPERVWALYKERVARASATARETLDRKLMAEVQREQTADWKRERAAIEDQVAAEVYARPEYQALTAIQRGTMPDGAPLVEGVDTPPLKLSKQMILERYGAERLARLPKPTLYTVDGGLDPDTVAAMFGYTSGDEMLTALENVPSMDAVIQAETARRMVEQHGSMLIDGSMHDIARAAVANDDLELVIRAEIRALSELRRTVAPFVAEERRAGKAQTKEALRTQKLHLETEAELQIARVKEQAEASLEAAEQDAEDLAAEVDNLRRKARGGASTVSAALPPAAETRELARAHIAVMRIADIRPDVFWSASRKAAYQAFERAARQDFDGAIVAKQNELINLAMYREAERRLEDVQAGVRYVRELTTKTKRATIGKAGANYLDQVDAILARFEFAEVSKKVLARRAALAKFLAGVAKDVGVEELPVEIPEELLDESHRRNYKELTVEEFAGVIDGLKSLVNLAYFKNRLLKAQDRREFAEVVAAISESIRTKGKGKPIPVEASNWDKALARGLDVIASHSKVAYLAYALDGFIDGGLVWQYIIRPLNAAADLEEDRRAKAAEAYATMQHQFYKRSELARFGDKVFIPAINYSLTKEARIAIALNWGNETSRQRVLADPNMARNFGAPVSEAMVEAIFQTLDARDFQFVQATWDYLNTFWPEIAAKQERVTGTAPEKVEALKVQTPYGELAGGYYPLVYDPRKEIRVGQLQEAGEAKLAQLGAFVRTTTRRGHVETRQERVTLPLKLELSVALGHVDQVLHDLTHHETLLDVQRILRSPAVASAILETQGDSVYRQFTEIVKSIAVGLPPAKNGVEHAVNYAKTGTQIVGLGLNLWTGAQQPLGMFNGMARVGGGGATGIRYVSRGLHRWLRDAAHMENTVKWIADVSPMMRNRTRTASQDLNDLRQVFRARGGWFDQLVGTVSGDRLTQRAILDGFLWHISVMQRVADVPTWLGEYEYQMDQKPDHDRAVALADQAVLDSQGGGQIKDLSEQQRGGPWARLWMTFYSYGATVFSASRRAVGGGKQPADIATALVNLGLIYIMPAAATIALSRAFGRTEGDEPWEYLEDVAREVGASAFNTMIGLRELSALWSEKNRDYAGPAGARALQLVYKLGQEVKQGEADHQLFSAINSLAGVLFFYPAGQVQRTVDGYIALAEGRTENPLSLLFGAPPKRARRR